MAPGQARREAEPGRSSRRGFLIALSCLVSLILLELGSTAWRGWMHRFPDAAGELFAAPAEEFRIVVLGGSSALGEPYRPWLSVGQIVAWRLAGGHPGAAIRVRDPGLAGRLARDAASQAGRAQAAPGMVIIYSGHNEFAARFEEERDGWLDGGAGLRLLQPIYRASLISPFCRLAYEIISKNRLDSPPALRPAPVHRSSAVQPGRVGRASWPTSSGRLEALAAYCERIGAVPILIIPPANEADYEPSRSTLPADRAGRESASGWCGNSSEARALESRDPDCERGPLRRRSWRSIRVCRGALSAGPVARARRAD